ncbi:hypothetical protein ZWY2020_014959 [Hordeum vulgare]|nr:hypothetical protein ZWY2020_014959 [Hordeum vulgare]
MAARKVFEKMFGLWMRKENRGRDHRDAEAAVHEDVLATSLIPSRSDCPGTNASVGYRPPRAAARPDEASISITEDQVSIRGKLKGSVLSDRASPVGRPDHLRVPVVGMVILAPLLV